MRPLVQFPSQKDKTETDRQSSCPREKCFILKEPLRSLQYILGSNEFKEHLIISMLPEETQFINLSTKTPNLHH